MSWLFSRALVAEYLAEKFLDGGQSAPSNGNPTPQAYCAPDKMTDFSRLSRFGMTFKPLTESRGEELLMLFLAGFPAKTLALPEKAQELTENEAECGDTWRALLARFDPDSSSWKTAQRSLLEDSDECSVTWPRSGMTADGQCWELPMSGRRTDVRDSGLWLTPTVEDAGRMGSAADWEKYTKNGQTSGARLRNQVQASVQMWPTPTVCGNYNRKGASPTSGNGLATAVKMWPTPTCQDAKNNGAPPQMERNSKPLNAEVGGSLNPTWVEWLMGWPLGWTDLRPLETDKSPCAPQKHGGF
jgi:hypothetical protein